MFGRKKVKYRYYDSWPRRDMAISHMRKLKKSGLKAKMTIVNTKSGKMYNLWVERK